MVTTGEGAWIMGKEGEGPSRNMYKGPIGRSQRGIGLRVGGGGGWSG